MDDLIDRVLPTRPQLRTLWEEVTHDTQLVVACAAHMEHAVTVLRDARDAYATSTNPFTKRTTQTDLSRAYAQWVAACERVRITNRVVLRRIRGVARYVLNGSDPPERIRGMKIEEWVELSMRVLHHNSGLQFIKDNVREHIGVPFTIRPPFDLRIPITSGSTRVDLGLVDMYANVTRRATDWFVSSACMRVLGETPLPTKDTSFYFLYRLPSIRETYTPTDSSAASPPRPTPRGVV